MSSDAEASKAYRIRKRVKKGQDVTARERAFLARYETKTRSERRGRPRAATVTARAPDVLPGAPPPVVDALRTDAPPQQQEPPREEPRPVESAEVDEGAGEGPPPIDVGPPPAAASSAPSSSSSASSSSSSTKPKEEPFRVDGVALAYCMWLKAASAELRARGWFAPPDELVDHAIAPAAKRLEALLAAEIGKHMNQEDLDAVVVIGPGVYVGGVSAFLKWRDKRAAEEAAAGTAAGPAPVPVDVKVSDAKPGARTAPAELVVVRKPPAPAASPPTANGALPYA